VNAELFTPLPSEWITFSVCVYVYAPVAGLSIVTSATCTGVVPPWSWNIKSEPLAATLNVIPLTVLASNVLPWSSHSYVPPSAPRLTAILKDLPLIFHCCSSPLTPPAESSALIILILLVIWEGVYIISGTSSLINKAISFSSVSPSPSIALNASVNAELFTPLPSEWITFSVCVYVYAPVAGLSIVTSATCTGVVPPWSWNIKSEPLAATLNVIPLTVLASNVLPWSSHSYVPPSAPRLTAILKDLPLIFHCCSSPLTPPAESSALIILILLVIWEGVYIISGTSSLISIITVAIALLSPSETITSKLSVSISPSISVVAVSNT